MARSPRYWIPNAFYHVTVRGNNRQQIFLDATDYQHYLIELRRQLNQKPCRLLAFALMPNHVHLVLEALPQSCPSEACLEAC